MIDLTLLRENPTYVTERLALKDPVYDTAQLIDLDQQVRSLRLSVEELRKTKNELAQQGKQGVTPKLIAQSKDVGAQLKKYETELKEIEQQFDELYVRCPNVPLDDVPAGNKESNVVVSTFGQKPSFSFPVKNHVELGEALGWFDFQSASVMTGSNFALYKGDAVRLMYALTMFMLEHNKSFGYQFILPPYLVNERSLEISGNFPKFKDQVYHVTQDNYYLIPTAEVALANMYRDTIFTPDQLPLRMTSWTSCFRREAGTYGATERGLIRLHQFEKVELYAYCEPEESHAELERMLECAQGLLEKLGLHYRVSLLAAQDSSFQAAKTYDIEVWMPGQDAYYEVSSCSNCTDFQARRGGMRYKETPDSKTKLVHTLNGSSLALPRLMVALLETYQQPDGSIKLPKVLDKFML